jgi:adenosylcobinamide kinase/adenosylcobinamide-phosphate guanylyltransferase
VLLEERRDAEKEIERLPLSGWGGPALVLVTNEVGCGIVPENALARRFRDLAGRLNQRVGAEADEIVWMLFGAALKVKG